MKFDYSPEVTVLLMACTLDVSAAEKEQLVQFLGLHQLNWDRLYTLSTRHRITPFLYRMLWEVPAVPKPFLARLQQDCRIAATDNLLKLHEYHSIESILTASAIEYMALKGIYLAEHAYPDSSLRISGDIDLLVRKEDVSKAIQVLEAHAYRLSPKHALHWKQGEQVILHDLFEVSLFKPFYNGSRFDIDLHWKIMNFNKDYTLFDLDYVRSEPAYRTEREILLLVVHHGVNNIWQQIYYINDLYFLLRKKEVDWVWLMQECRQHGIEQIFLVGLYWCKRIWKLDLPPFIQESLHAAKLAALAEEFAKNWEMEKPVEFSRLIVRQLFLFARAQTRVGRQLKIYATFLSSRVFRYSLFKVGNRMIYVPKEAGLITLFIRAFQSLFRFLPIR